MVPPPEAGTTTGRPAAAAGPADGDALGPERFVDADGARLCYQATGDPAGPTLLLVGGTGSSMDWWPADLCLLLAARGRRVVRYDHRDTGRSTSYPPGAPGYTDADLTDDAVRILDALGVAAAHVVGISGGGALAQRLAVDHPDRVATLTLVSTTRGLDAPGAGPLPPSSPGLAGLWDAPAPDPADTAALVEASVAEDRALTGRGRFHEARTRAVATRAVGRAADPTSGSNHFLAEPGRPVHGTLSDIAAPTLVVHGSEDPLFPGHGEALAAEIPNARLVVLDGVGHQVPPPDAWDVFVPELLRHTAPPWAPTVNAEARASVAAGDATGWFERVFAAGSAGEIAMPWDRDRPHPLLVDWTRRRHSLDPDSSWDCGQHGGERCSAVVVGCGLGADAEHLAAQGYRTTAFDVAPTAVREARRRHAGTVVDYRVADLLDLPAAWHGAFDLVVDVITVQALPPSLRAEATASVARLVAPGGTLVVVQAMRDDDEPPEGPPWPLTRAEIEAFATGGLVTVSIERIPDVADLDTHRWRAVFRRP